MPDHDAAAWQAPRHVVDAQMRRPELPNLLHVRHEDALGSQCDGDALEGRPDVCDVPKP